MKNKIASPFLRRLALAAACLSALAAGSARAQSATDLTFLNQLEEADVNYFLNESAATTYLMPDSYDTTTNATSAYVGSSATGYELAALCIATSHGWITTANAESRVQAILTTVWGTATTGGIAYDIANGTNYYNYCGLPYQYMAPGTAKMWKSSTPVSTDDGAKFIEGLLVARQYFSGDSTLVNLANKIFDNVNWQGWVRATGAAKNQIYLTWSGSPSGSSWGQFSEGPLQTYLLGMAAADPTLPNYTTNGLGGTNSDGSNTNWSSWTRGPYNTPYSSTTTGDTYTWIGNDVALFTHQYPEAFYDLYSLIDESLPNGDPVPPGGGSGVPFNYWNDATQATLAQWAWCQDVANGDVAGITRQSSWGTSGAGTLMWGLTSSGSESNGYEDWGCPYPTVTIDGTLTPAAAGGSLPYATAQCLQALENMQTWNSGAAWSSAPVGARTLSTSYGFVDSFNPNPSVDWADNTILTNQVGQTLLMAENCQTGMIWKLYMSCPEVIYALNAAQLAPNGSGTVGNPDNPVSVGNTGSWTTTGFAAQSSPATFSVVFDAAPSASPTSAYVAISDGSQSLIGQYPCLVRFNSSGYIDARDGGANLAANSIAYSAGTTYSFRLVIDVATSTYSIYVQSAGGTEQIVGLNYAFRTGVTPSTLNYWGTMEDATGSGSLTVNNLLLY